MQLGELWLVVVGWEPDAEIVKIKDVIRLSSANLIRSQIYRLLIAAFSIARPKLSIKGIFCCSRTPLNSTRCAASKKSAPLHGGGGTSYLPFISFGGKFGALWPKLPTQHRQACLYKILYLSNSTKNIARVQNYPDITILNSLLVFWCFCLFVFLFFLSFCLPITLIKCLKGLKFQKSLFVSKF